MTVKELQLILKMMGRMYEKHPVFWFIEIVSLLITALGMISITWGHHPENGVVMIIAVIIYHGVLVGNTMLLLTRMAASKVIPQVDPRWHLMKPDDDHIKKLEEETQIGLEHGEILDDEPRPAVSNNWGV